ncbi:hypothetical protein BDP55DRAFT_644197 [Colletotrichum godetiae]|uniref:MACPF-like domain-containing protein n=1 Tax=Colletotrichum godetiae TaxID=1209918 RepID=A0AAJ0EZ26_9PEZI|nr:uncharacterized protein BDP55DRAFT_644197 [Colletotrichum godetiae]KAK1700797.1 hypothetical protein BDP55DRAFT_644197 [Colletotrichum godetiae]
MEDAYISPPSSAGARTFNDVTRRRPDLGTIVTFQRIDKLIPASTTDKSISAVPIPLSGSCVGTIGLAVLLKKCGIDANAGMDDVSMATIKEGMISIGLAKQFDIWSSPSSKLLDYDLTLLEYVYQVSKLTNDPELNVRIYYGLKKDHDEQTIQDVYRSGNFVIKVLQMRRDKSQVIQSLRVMTSLPEDPGSGILGIGSLGSQTLGDLRDKITAMSRLATKHQFCLPDETPLHDTTAFEDYVNLLDETCPYENSVPSIKLRFKDTSSSLIDEDKSKLALAASGGNQQAQKAENSNISPSSLDEIQWRRVIKNCQVMHGWYIDRANNEAKMAPKPAFRLRPGLNLELDSTEGAAAGDAIPNYGVTDGTQIDVVTAETDIRNSLVRNNFEKSSIDSKMAIGYAGVGVSVAATSSTESQSAQSAKNKSSTKENIGKYKIPRVTLFLNADDLVPTREFIENIEKIKKQADVTDIRKFHERFGKFFCHQVILGGMLLSTKTLIGNERVDEEKQRCDFKRAIGMSISSPVEVAIGADSKRENTSGANQNVNRSYMDNSDSVVFEAVGGNTILASNPAQWCATVGDHNNWRVIGRADMKPILESLAECGEPRCDDAAKVFAEASQVPFTKFIDIPKSTKIIAQFRFKRRSTNEDRTHYLRHNIHALITPTSTTERRNMPEKFQGPRVEPYDHTWKDEDGIWTIAPVLDARAACQGLTQLVDGSMVTIRSGGDSQTPWFLSVLRTSAGIFVPCITTSEQFVWRIREVLRPNSTKSTIPRQSSFKPLRHDARLCLTFEFLDNPRGYRDFKDDDRGFRNVEYPDSDTGRLFLVESTKRSDTWPDRRVLLLADGSVFRSESCARIMDLDDAEISVRIAHFNIDVRDSTDDAYDILQKDGNSIQARHEEQQRKLKTGDQGASA